jgi:hypothetical protein
MQERMVYIYIYIYIRNTTMFVSGTKDFPQDHWDDLKIPFNLTAESLRYRNADKALQIMSY